MWLAGMQNMERLEETKYFGKLQSDVISQIQRLRVQFLEHGQSVHVYNTHFAPNVRAEIDELLAF